MALVIDLRPPDAAGPLRIGSERTDMVRALREFGEPRLVTTAPGRTPSWAVDRSSGLTVRCHLDRIGHLHAVEFGRPANDADSVRYQGLDVFGTPASQFVAALRRHTAVIEENHGYAYIAPDLLLSCWRGCVPKNPDDVDGRHFDSILLARPGYYNPN